MRRFFSLAAFSLLVATFQGLAPAALAGETPTDIEGRSWGPEDLDGKLVLYDFWATWCPPCLAELPHLRSLHKRYDAKDLVILGVAMDAIDRRGLRSFLLRHDVTWPQIHAAQGAESELARRFDVEAVPATVLLDRQGRIVAKDLRGKALEVVIETLVGEK